jgi:hypothetical protein
MDNCYCYQLKFLLFSLLNVMGFLVTHNTVLCNEAFRNSCSVPNVVRMNRSRRMRWAAYAAHVRKRIVAYHNPGREVSKEYTSWKI